MKLSLLLPACILAFVSFPTTSAYYPEDVTNVWTTRRMVELRDARVVAPPPTSEEWRSRSVAEFDGTGREVLGRADQRINQRNYNRHFLGWQRQGRYRVLNMNGDQRRNEVTRLGKVLPPAIVTTGGSAVGRHGIWGYPRPTRRSIRDNNYQFNGIVNRDRDLLQEIREWGMN